jgi:hypothetical protein
MVGIGGCDYCGEFCASLGVNAVENFEFNGWIPESAKDRHRDLVARRIDCSFEDGDEYSPGRHVGPLHDRRGRKLATCRHCTSRSQMDIGWDSSLDHGSCTQCWEKVAGGMVLRRLRALAGNPSWTSLPTSASEENAPHLSTSLADRARVAAAVTEYLGPRALPITWVPSPLGVVTALQSVLDRHPDLDARPDAGEPVRWSIRATPVAIESNGAETDVDLSAEDEDDDGDDDEGIASGMVLPEGPGAAIARVIAAAIAGSSDTPVARAVGIVADAGQFSDLGAELSGDGDPIDRLRAELRASAGPVVVLGRKIIASERPLLITLDEQGRPHAEDRPAMAWPDLVVHAWHGVAVASWVIEHPDRIDIAGIDAEPNAKIRRVMIERFGAERLVREGGATLIHEDEAGRLWRRDGRPTNRRARPDEPIVVVEVVNSTPEPDGSRRTYFLRVPPSTTSARDAVAWTFGMSGHEYRPSFES